MEIGAGGGKESRVRAENFLGWEQVGGRGIGGGEMVDVRWVSLDEVGGC